MRSDRPNILVIMSDQHNASVAGCYGNSIAQTPHLDALAAEGVTFDGCYTASPLCVPARLAFTAGQYVSSIGAWANSCKITDETTPTLPGVLAEGGYETVLCGKMHYAPNRRYGFQVDLGANRFNDRPKSGRIKRRPADDLTPRMELSERFDDFHPGTESKVLNHDKLVTAKAAEYIRNHDKDQGPFFMLAGYEAPHYPLIVPREYWEPFQDRVPIPEIPDGFLDSLPRNYHHLRAGFSIQNVPDHLVKVGRELYYGLTKWLDDQIGQLLQALNESDAADNTVVIYVADHGENLGEHGLWWKNAMYEQAARVPLIISWPQRWQGGQRRTAACSHLDLVQTIADLAEVSAPADWNGDSMCGWIDSPESPWKDLAVSQYYAHNIASGYAMIRRGKYKYVYHSPADEQHLAEHELYDLAADPGEFANLAEDPAYRQVVSALFADLVSEVGEHPDETEARCRTAGVGYKQQATA